MKKTILGTAAIAAAILMASCGQKNNGKDAQPTATPAANSDHTDGAAQKQGLKLAYVNADTLNQYYQFLIDKKAEFERKQNAYESEIAQKEKSLQNEFLAFQKKAQAGTLTESEGMAAEKKLRTQQEALEKRHMAITNEMAKLQDATQEEFQNTLDKFLENFNKDKNYDFIFTYSKNGGFILFADQAYDITKEVLDALNEDYKSNKSKSK